MSLTDLQYVQASVCFPRVSGDEPAHVVIWRLENGFSPRERG